MSCNTNVSENTGTDITPNQVIQKINNSENIQFVDKTITGNIDFTEIENIFVRSNAIGIAEINSAITFINCNFKDSIIAFEVVDEFATICYFNKPVTFINCTFDKNINFRQSTFKDNVEFSGCTFADETRFEGVFFNGNENNFRESTFEKLAKFTNATFSGDISFMNSVFNADAGFNNCFFDKNANFGACNYSEMANFGNIEVRGYFRANYSIYYKKAYFQDCIFNGKVEAVKINSKGDFVFAQNIFRNDANFNNSVFTGNFNFSKNLFIENKCSFEDIKVAKVSKIEIDDNKTLNSNLKSIDIEIISE